MAVYGLCGQGGVSMFNKLKNEKVIIDLEILVKNTENLDEDINSYAEFMKERILSVSGVN